MSNTIISSSPFVSPCQMLLTDMSLLKSEFIHSLQITDKEVLEETKSIKYIRTVASPILMSSKCRGEKTASGHLVTETFYMLLFLLYEKTRHPFRNAD